MTTGTAGSVGIIGTGTMGAGIAQVAATNGWTVRLRDVDEATVNTAIAGVVKRLDRLVEKGRLTAPDRDAAKARLVPAPTADDLASCDLIIEAIVEDLGVKTTVLREVVPHLAPTAIIATNTSSLCIGAIGTAIGEPARTVGMHFFNPAPLLKLVEVIAGDETDPAVVDRTATIATNWGKTVARAADVPGFIVNHVARPYYLEAFRILEDGHATAAEIDEAMTRFGGFRMGPFALTDLIGQDVNTATTRSVWTQLDHPPLLTPSRLQEQLVADGHLGRKSGRGVYDYEADPPTPALETELRGFDPSPELRIAVDDFAGAAVDANADGGWPERYVFARILVALIAQATLAHQRGVAAKDDIDTAMRFGVNYPEGPFAWQQRIGVDRCAALLEALDNTTADTRFAVTTTV